MKRFWPWLVAAVLAGLAYWSWQTGGIVAELTTSATTSAQKVAAVKQFFRSCGPWAPLVYVLFVTAEVVIAPIPGILLYAPGGMIFGTVLGGTLALAGNTLGAGVSCALVRSIGQRFVNRFADDSAVGRLQTELEHRGGWYIFILRINPLTSSDLVSYASGLARIRVSTVMLATFCGMAPLCYLQAWLSDTLFNRFPWLIVPLLILSVCYIVAVIVVVRRLLNRPGSSLRQQQSTAP